MTVVDGAAGDDIQLARESLGKDAGGRVLKDKTFESGCCRRVVVETGGQVPTLREIKERWDDGASPIVRHE